MPSENTEHSCLDWATPEFFNNVLGLDRLGSSVASVDKNVTLVSKQGDNYASSMLRIRVKLSGNDVAKKAEIPLIIKTLPVQKDLAENLAGSTTFTTETRMYSETLPKLELYLNKAYPEQDNTLGPKFYHVLSKPPYNLIMEDLIPGGYVIANRREGLDLHHCEAVIKAIANFHAASFALHSEDKQSIEVYDSHPFLRGPGTGFSELVSRALNRFSNVLEHWPEDYRKFAEKVRNKSSTLCQELADAFNHGHHRFKVLNHGDLWVNNIMFGYDKVSGDVDKVKFVDFQLSYYTSPAMDLQYFLNTSPREDVRVQHTKHLLQLYHKELCAAMNLLQCGKHEISYEELIQEYENKAVLGLFSALFILPVLVSDPKDAPDFVGARDEEAVNKAAINRFTNEAFAKPIRRLLPYFESIGLL